MKYSKQEKERLNKSGLSRLVKQKKPVFEEKDGYQIFESKINKKRKL